METDAAMIGSSPRPRLLFVGPRPDAPGGIAQFETNLIRAVRDECDARVTAFRRLYPRFTRAGRQPLDDSAVPVDVKVSPVLLPWSPGSWNRAVDEIHEFGPDLVVIQWWHPIAALAARHVADAAAANGAKVAFVCHNSTPHERFPFAGSLARAALDRADQLLALSDPVAADLRLLAPSTPVDVIAHPANIGAQAPGSTAAWRERIAAGGPVVLFFGNVRPYKGLEDLVATMPLVRRRVPATLVVAGRFFRPEEGIRRLAREYDIEDSVRIFPDYVPAEQVGGLFEIADVVALPYRSASQSGIVAQAAFFGKPVVATAVGGLPEAVGDRGVIVPAHDRAALADGLVRALLDPPPAPIAGASWQDWRHALLALTGTREMARALA
jgi:glycosyltransferase involved in cell wall biosynthesis